MGNRGLRDLAEEDCEREVKMRCDLCGRLLNKRYKWILERQGYENMIVCYECDLSIQNQIFDIIQKPLLIQQGVKI